jgi:predicted RNase H-like nuclease (RuvC/YqgF family)
MAFKLFVLIGLLLPTLAAQAQIYSCKDPSGKVITSDRPIPECARSDMRVLNADGSTKQVIPAPMNAEQRTRAAEEQKRADDARRAAEEQKRKDRALLQAYKTEQEMVDTYVRQLSAPVQGVKASHARIKNLRQELDRILQEAEFYKGKAWPVQLRRKLSEVTAGIESENRAIAERADDVARLNEKFAEERTRYRVLVAKAASQQVH